MEKFVARGEKGEIYLGSGQQLFSRIYLWFG